MILEIILLLIVIVWAWLMYQWMAAPLMPDDWTNEPTKKKKPSHDRLGGNLKDAHMRNNKK